MANVKQQRNFDLAAIDAQLRTVKLHEKNGRVSNGSGPLIRAKGEFSIGEVCSVSRTNKPDLLAEVVGFNGAEAILTPYGTIEGVSHRSRIAPAMPEFQIGVGPALSGRILDAMGQPIDGAAPPDISGFYSAMNNPPDPMHRPVISEVFEFGVRALDAALTCGVGQRLGIFAAAGGGKSTLLSMLAKFSVCDRIIIALIGERGREVREFVEHSLGSEGMEKSVLIVATSDRPAIEQVKAAYTATTLAEYFRDQGENVLLLMDSLTRFARAQRQIGLAAGEPPTRRGYPPSIFEKLPALLERTGLNENGSITALYTVLVEGDDMNEPVADEVRSLLDGHIILSRKLAEKGHYPAIDVTASASRVMQNLIPEEQLQAVLHLKRMLAKYEEIELLVQMGEYERGSDREADQAISQNDAIKLFLQQSSEQNVPYFETIAQLMELGRDD